MAKPKNTLLATANDYVNTQVPADKNAKVYDITMRYVFDSNVHVEEALLAWTNAAAQFAQWQGQITEIVEVDQSTLPPSSPAWAKVEVFTPGK